MKSKTIIIALLIILVIAALSLGVYLGQKQGMNQSQNNLQPIINTAFPKPPAVLNNLSGVVKAVYSGTIDIIVKDPNDNLPHADGSPQNTQLRFANLTGLTKIFSLDYTKHDAQGNPLQIPLQLSDIKSGDIVKVTSDQNILNAQSFDVTEVEVIR